MVRVGAKWPGVLQRDMQAEPVQNSQAFQIDPGRFREWFEAPDPEGDFEMPALPQRIREALGTEATLLVFSAETLAKQKAGHKDLSAENYIRVLNKVGGCDEFYDRGQSHIGLIIEAEHPYMVILKPTANRLEAYMVSLRKIEPRQVRSLRARGKRL